MNSRIVIVANFCLACATPAAAQIGVARSSTPLMRSAAECAAMLSAPTRDSVTERIGVRITAFDTSNAINADYRALMGQGLREVLHIPRPLPLDLYGPTQLPSSTPTDTMLAAVVTIRGAYRARIWADGRVSDVRVVGGARTKLFDDAFVSALRAMSDSGLMPPFPRAHAKRNDNIDLHFSVQTMDTTRAASGPIDKSIPPAEALFVMRVPAFTPLKQVSMHKNAPAPIYPIDLRMGNVEGTVVIEFTVDESGKADLGSVQVTSSSADQFAKAVLTDLPHVLFYPATVNQCPIPIAVHMPFNFALTR